MNKKFIEEYDVEDFEVLTDTGWEDCQKIYKTVMYDVWEIITETGKSLQCADNHYVIDENYNSIFVKDCIENKTRIITQDGLEKIIHVHKLDIPMEHMYDVSIKSKNHTLFTNGILSHNSTLMTIYALWMTCFQDSKRVVLVANKANTAIILLRRVAMAYEELPNWLKPGVEQFGKTEMIFGNRSSIAISTTSGSAVRGDTVNCVTGKTNVMIKDKNGKVYKIPIELLSQVKNNKTLSRSIRNIEKYIVNTCLIEYNTKVNKNENKLLDVISKVKGLKLQYQHQIGSFVVDGIDENKKVIIEINERHHLNRKTKQRDIAKYANLVNSGYHVYVVPDLVSINTDSNTYKQYKHAIQQIKGVDIIEIHLSNFDILTDSGWSQFCGIRKTRTDQIIHISTKNGKYLDCTPNHRILCDSGTKFAYDITPGAKIKVIDGYDIVDSAIVIDKMHDVYDIVETNDNTVAYNDVLCKQCLILDEFAHIEDHIQQSFFASVIPTISSSRKNTTKIFMVSTPKGTGNKFHEIFTKAQKGEADESGTSWHKEEFYWNDVPGRSSKWKKQMIAALGGDIESFKQEFEGVFLETGESAIDNSLLEEMSYETRPPIQIYDNDHYRLWQEPTAGRIYGIGVDVSEGIARAASVAQVFDFTDLTCIEQVAVYHDTLIHPLDFAAVLNRIGHHWGTPPILIERNNIGGEVVDTLDSVHHYPNIVTYAREGSNAQRITRLGIDSTIVTRTEGIMNMRYWVNSTRSVKIYDAATLNEFKTFVRHPNGVWRKKNGDNIFDDRVLSAVWALFLLHKSIVTRYYDVVDEDMNGKPLRIAAYQVTTDGTFTLDPFFQEDPHAPLPAFIGAKGGTDYMKDLEMQGWKKL